MRGLPADPGDERGRPLGVHALRRGASIPFIHALDVVERATVCIDLDMIHARKTYGATLEIERRRPRSSSPTARAKPSAIVDTETFEASEPAIRGGVGDGRDGRWLRLPRRAASRAASSSSASAASCS